MMFSKEWNQILDKVAQFQKNQFSTWFRGQKDSSFTLQSGLYRKKLNSAESHIGTEKTYYNIFRRMGHLHHEEEVWNLLYLMQHYGVKTRLLDWTESFSTALYFAYLEWDLKTNCSVYMLSPLGLNEKVTGKATYYIPGESYESHIRDPYNPAFHNHSLALYPFRNNPRIVAQPGMFTIQGIENTSLEQEHNRDLLKEGILKKIKIKPELIEDVEKYLKLVGINPFTLFPDLDGLAKYINNLGYFRPRDAQ